MFETRILPVTDFDIHNYVDLFVLIGILYLDMFFQIIPVVYVALFYVIYVIKKSTLVENIFMCFVFFPKFSGCFLISLGLPHIGGACNIIALLLLAYGISVNKIRFVNFYQGAKWLFVFFVLLSFSVLVTEGGNYALTKLLKTIVNGSVFFVAYNVLFSNKEKVDFIRMGGGCLVLAMFYLRGGIDLNHIFGPNSVVDFGFFRTQTLGLDDWRQKCLIGYQHIGFMVVVGIGFFLCVRNSISMPFMCVIFMLSFLITVYAGSRQAILGVVVLFGIWFACNIKQTKMSIKLLVLLFLIIVIWLIFPLLTQENGILTSIVEDGFYAGGGRKTNLDNGMEGFFQNPILGCGFGRYTVNGLYLDTGGVYAHNIFIEILGELGLLGVFVIIPLTLVPIKIYNREFSIIVYLLLAYLSRAMASGGLDTNIILFSVLFASPALCNIRNESLN